MLQEILYCLTHGTKFAKESNRNLELVVGSRELRLLNSVFYKITGAKWLPLIDHSLASGSSKLEWWFQLSCRPLFDSTSVSASELGCHFQPGLHQIGQWCQHVWTYQVRTHQEWYQRVPKYSIKIDSILTWQLETHTKKAIFLGVLTGSYLLWHD